MKLYPVFVLLPSCSTKFTTNFAKIFVVNEGRRTKTGYGFMSRCFVLIRVRICVSIHKQLDMNLQSVFTPDPKLRMRKINVQDRQKLSTTSSSSDFVLLLKLSICRSNIVLHCDYTQHWDCLKIMFVKPPIVMFCISQNTIMIINYFIRFTLLKLPRGEVYDMLMHLSPPQRFQ